MNMVKKVTKAVIPAAGFGTRFLPQTKAMPKEMLPLVDKPIIQYIVESLIEAGIKDIIIVTGYHKRSIEDHFDSPQKELIENLITGGEKKKHLLEEVEKISNLANFIFVRQKGPYGNGTPLVNVRPLIKDEPFIYTWADDMIVSQPNEFKQLIKVYEKYRCSVLASIKASSTKDYNKYGVAGGKFIEDGLVEINELIEKPGKGRAPSNLCNVSGFLFMPEIFNYLDEVLENLADGKEFYYNDALNLMLKDNKKILAAEIKNGKYIDTGNVFDYLKAVNYFAINNKKIGKKYKKYLKNLNGKIGN